MKKNLSWIIIIIVVLFFVGCNIFQSDNNNQQNSNFKYPLSIGNSWQYEKLFTLDFDSSATYNGLSDTTYYSSGLVEIIDNEVIFDTLDAYNFETTIDEDGNIFTGNEYYNTEDNSLISYGYINPQMMTPKVENEYAYIMFKNKKFNNVTEIINWIEKGYYGNEYSKEDSIIFDPVKSLDYPLEEGKQWVYRYELYGGEPWRIDKIILGWEEIKVSAGKFNCWKIQWLFEVFEDIIMFDYISEKGLVKRILEFSNMECYDEDANFLGYMDCIGETTLINYTIE